MSSTFESHSLTNSIDSDYRNCVYRIFTNNSYFDLKIDNQNNGFSRFLISHSYFSYAIVSSYNPFSIIQSKDLNQKMQNKLINIVRSEKHSFLLGINMDPSGVWEEEESICIFNLSLRQACDIGIMFRQKAIVFGMHDAHSELIYL